MHSLDGLVEFDVRAEDRRKLHHVKLEEHELSHIRGDRDRVEWYHKINDVADGKVRRITNIWNQITNRDLIHTQFEPVNNETNIYQLIMLVKEKPQTVAASFIPNIAENNEQPRTWVSELTTDNNRHFSRGVFRDRIRLDEKYYKYHRRHRDIDQSLLIDVGQEITCTFEFSI